MVIASFSVNSVSAVPWIRNVGTRMLFSRSGPAPREANQSRMSLDTRPVVTACWKAVSMCESYLCPCALPYRTEPQPPLAEPSLSRLVINEFQAMVGAITSTRGSRPVATNWIPPASYR